MENKNYPQYFQEQILGVLINENLKSIADEKENYFLSQDYLINLYSKRYFRNFQNEISANNIEENNELFDDEKAELQIEKIWKISFDIKNCNDDLKLFIANLYLFHPHINDPTKEKNHIEGRVLHSYNQNFSDWNYSSLVSCCFEKLYNYWDRMGDFLALYLISDIKNETVINFAFVIDYLDKQERFSEDKNFMFLKSFKETEFKEFNKNRKEVVHYNHFETTYRYDFIKFKNDEDKINDLWKWKNEMPEYFKNHLELTIKGYAHCFEFIKKHFNK